MFLDTDDLYVKFDSRKDKFKFNVLRVRTLKVEINVTFLHLKSFVGWSQS